MTIILSNYSSALKEILLPYIQDNFPKKTILLDQMKRNSGGSFINDEFIAPVRTSRHGGVVSLANDGNNINAGSVGASTSRGTVSTKTHTAAFNITKLAVDASKTNQGAVEAALTFQARTLTTDFARHVNRQLYSDGVGVVGQVLGSVGAGTVSLEYPDGDLDDGRSVDWYGTINDDIAVNKYFAAGQIVGIGTGGADLGTVTSVTGTSIVMSGSPASAANDTIYLIDGSGGGAGTAEIEGVRAALSSSTGTSTYAGLARSTTGWSPQFGSTSEALTLSRMENAYLKAKEYSEMDDKYAIFVNVTLYQKYGDILTAMRRAVNKADLLGGWTGLEFAAGAGRVGVFLDYEVPDGEVVILNMDSWTIAQVGDINWLEDPSAGALLRLQNTISWQATLAWFANVMCLAPAANARETRKSD